MRAAGVGVGGFAGDAVFLRHVFGGEAHADVGLGTVLDQPRIGPEVEPAHRHRAHAFGAAGDHHLAHAGEDLLGAERDRLQARRAEPVDGLRGHGLGQTRAQGDQAAHVEALRAFRHGAAHDHVVDVGRVEARHAGERALDHGSAEVFRAHLGEGAFAGFADRGAGGGNDDGFFGHRAIS